MRKTGPLQIDLETLLSPISAERPSGESLRYEGTYDRIQEERKEDNPNLPQGVWETSLKTANWEAVREISIEALETRSKDLQLAVWLLEAWLHLHGFSGVREGLKLLTGLCESFWASLYPEIEGNGLEYRLSPIHWLNEKFAIKLEKIPITRPQSEDEAPYTWIDREDALRLENSASDNPAFLESAESEGKITLAQFNGAVMLSPVDFYATLSEELSSTINAAQALEQILDEKCGDEAPSLRQIKETTAEVQRFVSQVLKERGAESESSVSNRDSDMQIADWADEPEIEHPAEHIQIRSRAEAYRLLSEAAEYLLKTEPHSPAPYLVKRAVSWGSMTLSDLLQEFINNETDLRTIYILLGMKEGGDQ